MTNMTLHGEIEVADGPGAHLIPLRFEAHDFVLDIEPGQRVEHILAIVAARHGLIVEDIYLVIDESEEPLDCSHVFHDSGHHHRHHVHHRHPVDVTVSYQAATHARAFRRHAPLENVLDWAIRAFSIDPAMAGEFELTKRAARTNCRSPSMSVISPASTARWRSISCAATSRTARTMLDPAEARVRADLDDPGFLAGVTAGRWRVLAFCFPVLDFVVAATELDGTAFEYGFRGDLTNFPATNPMVRIWNLASGVPLAPQSRPTGNARVAKTFQFWGDDTVYRPWDRMTGPHNNNAAALPHLAWRPDRHLLFFFEDIHGILNLNGRAHRLRAAA